MSENGVVDEVEGFLRERSRELTTPRPGECLACFVARMLRSFGCDTTLRWAQGFRDQRAPKATALERRLGQMGGYCDCELFLNGISMVERLQAIDPETDEADGWPAELPSVRGRAPRVDAVVRRLGARPGLVSRDVPGQGGRARSVTPV